MAYFPANPGWERQRKGEKKKIIVPIISYLTPNKELKKNSKKIEKTKKHHNRFFSGQNWMGKVEKE